MFLRWNLESLSSRSQFAADFANEAHRIHRLRHALFVLSSSFFLPCRGVSGLPEPNLIEEGGVTVPDY